MGYQGKVIRPPGPYPIIMGHEVVGHIEEIGDAAAKRPGVKVGQVFLNSTKLKPNAALSANRRLD